MSVKVMTIAWQIEGLDPTQKLVLLKLADNANETDYVAFPSISTIAKQAGCSARTVQRHLANLEQKGLIRRKNQYAGNGRQKVNLYYVLHPDLVGCQIDTPDTHDTPEGDTHDTPITLNRHREPSTINNTRGTRLPADWFPEPLPADFKTKHGLTDQHCADQLDQFRDYWAAAPGQRGVKLDWQATWRNWLRNSRTGNPSRGSPPQRKSAMRNTLDALGEIFGDDDSNETGDWNASSRLAIVKR